MGGGVVAFGDSLGRRVACVARRGLEVALAEFHVLHVQRHAQSLAQIAAEALVLVGRLSAKPVVHMECLDPRAQPHGNVEQAHRVRTARQHH